jgi:nitrite reductase/ring-hydroxylating ferredoxin subunit
MNIHQPIPMLPVEEAAKLRGSGALPSRPYHDPDWYELERKAIFMRTWMHIGHVCEIPEPGNFILRELEFAKASLLIVRGKQGEVRAFHNVCTHRGTQLVQEAEGKRNQFSCPYHMWTYGTDGKLLSAPDFERFYVKKEDCSLKSVHCEAMAGMIFVNLAAEPKQSLREFFGAIADQLETLPVARATHFTEYTYVMEANWKTNFDNFQENYHLRFVHPRNSEAILTEENPFGYPVEYGFSGPHRSQTLPPMVNPNYTPPQSLLHSAMLGKQIAANEGLQYPKIDFKCFPCLHFVGLAPNFFTHTMTPLDVGRTRAIIRMYWTSPVDSASKLYAREFSQMSIRDVLAEDRPAIESAQRGLSSGAMEMIQFQDHEMLPRHLYETVAAMVADYQAEVQSAG